jgi:hypothetical protein
MKYIKKQESSFIEASLRIAAKVPARRIAFWGFKMVRIRQDGEDPN